MAPSATRLCAKLALIGGAGVALAACAIGTPVVDHHQHVFSDEVAALLSGADRPFQPLDAGDVVRELDRAGIQRAVLLSVGYLFASPNRAIVDAASKTRAENDWTAAQAAAHPSRLVAMCGVNPLDDHAVAEIERCSRTPGLQRGIKLHFGNSDVQLDDAGHLSRVQRVFAAANTRRMAVVVHLRASVGRQRPYGARQARIFLDQVMPHATDVPVQVAHFAGTGPGYGDGAAQDAMRELAAAVAAGEPHAQGLWFDMASIVVADPSPAQADTIVGFIRAVGPDRVLFGSDAAVGTNLRPAEAWAAFRQLPLSTDELNVIASNVAPYLR